MGPEMGIFPIIDSHVHLYDPDSPFISLDGR